MTGASFAGLANDSVWRRWGGRRVVNQLSSSLLEHWSAGTEQGFGQRKSPVWWRANSLPPYSWTPSSDITSGTISAASPDIGYGLPRLGRLLARLSTVLRLFCTACGGVGCPVWAGDDGGRAPETAKGERTADVPWPKSSVSPSAPSGVSGSRTASRPVRRCVILRLLPRLCWGTGGSWACFSCNSTSI